MPRICFVNKMDRMGANFHRTVEMIVTNLAATPLVLQVRPFLCVALRMSANMEKLRVSVQRSQNRFQVPARHVL